MATAGGRGKGTGRPHSRTGSPGGRAKGAARAKDAPRKSAASLAQGARPRATPPAAVPAGPFRLGAIEGATPGKWIGVWRERMPQVTLELVPLDLADQRAALEARTVDAALVRLPIDRTGLHIIALYDEVPVVVCAADSTLTAADELTAEDLVGEVLIVPDRSPLEIAVAGTTAPRFAPPPTVAEAIALVAAGVGVVVVPMSLARLHHRKDVAHRPLVGGPPSTVALAWPARTDGAVDPLVDTFIGIVRGRTANSSR